MFCLLPFAFYFAERRASTIGATCMFDTKKYKNEGRILAVSHYVVWNKRFFQISDFCSALPSLLVEN
jgi:hypothetical protein